MKSSFKKYVEQEQLFSKKDALLVAVSGGVDSMVLLHLLNSAGYKIAIAHCNFSLRGKESDAEEKLVRKVAKALQLNVFVNQFNTLQYAKNRGVSTQMAARELRYDWFNQLCAEHEYSKVVVAHHLDDQIETVLLNLTRGTGVMGLTGMAPANGNVVRPLLFATREEIEAYAKSNKIEWKEDSSNQEDKYARNKIRHHVVPLLKSINPGLYQTFTHSEQRIKNVQVIYAKEKADYLVNASFDGGWKFPVQATVLDKYQTALFREMLMDFGFSHSQVEDVLESASAASGKQFLGDHCRLIKDRKDWILAPHSKQQAEYLVEVEESLTAPLKMEVKIKTAKAIKFSKDPALAYLDCDKLRFPLKLRKWKKGDFFYPFGMKGKVKLSDYFVNHKFSLADKENAWILESGGDIVWLVGQRIDDRFKVGQKTKKVYLAHLK
ncbi:MAG: tRNA lysidine(34) synthetase TilS [Bacteroidetes bacterium]|nr:tRNA lysidine(34) synthetase TilS [Bacteroidota bacterium]